MQVTRDQTVPELKINYTTKTEGKTLVVYEPSRLSVEPAAATASLLTPLICK